MALNPGGILRAQNLFPVVFAKRADDMVCYFPTIINNGIKMLKNDDVLKMLHKYG